MHAIQLGKSAGMVSARSLCVVLCLTACAEIAADRRASPAGARAPDLDVSRFIGIRSPTNPILASDGTLYVRDWPDGTNQLYRIDSDGTQTTKLSSFKDGMAAYTLSPDGRRLILSAGVGGNEQTQLYVLDTDASRGGLDAGASKDGSPPRALLANPAAVFRLEVWLADSSGFVYAANDVKSEDFHLYRLEFARPGDDGPRITPLLAREGSWSARDITHDGKRLLVGRYVSESDARAYELDVASGELRALEARDGRDVSLTSNTAAIGYLPGEQAVLLESDAGGGTRRVWSFDLATGKASRPIAELERFELDEAAMNDEGDLLAAVTNEDGFGVLHLHRLPGFEPVVLPPIERGVVSLGSLRGRELVWTLANSRTPEVAFAFQAPVAGERTSSLPAARALTRADTCGLDLSRFALPELVEYRSFDGLEVPAFLYLPAARDRSARREPIPFVVNFHGGPEGQFRPGFDRAVQALVARGFGVLQPNVRGSTGYGKAYQELDNYKKRWDSVKDGVEAARWLVAQGYAAPGKIAAYGGSYGGFMTVAAVIEGADVFGAAIDVVGIVNMETFLEGTKAYRRKLREAEYGPLEDREFLRSISPLHRADEIRVPMLIAHGLNDPRVPVGEALQLAVQLQRRDLDPELLFFPDEGHGFAKLENRLLFYERAVRFLERTIGQDAPSADV